MDKKTKNKFMALVEECIANKESIPGSIYSWYIDQRDLTTDTPGDIPEEDTGE